MQTGPLIPTTPQPRLQSSWFLRPIHLAGFDLQDRCRGQRVRHFEIFGFDLIFRLGSSARFRDGFLGCVQRGGSCTVAVFFSLLLCEELRRFPGFGLRLEN